MLSAVFATVDLTAVEDAVGAAVYARGAHYARQRAVIRMQWNSAEGSLQGTVRGRAGNFYTTTAHFSSSGGDGLELEHGECDCPVGFNCKHVAALVLTAAETERSQPMPARAPQPPTWEQSLNSVLTSRPVGPAARTDEAPLAIELTLAANTRPRSAPGSAEPAPAVKVLARLVTPGKNGWVGGGLSWTKLDSLRHYSGYVPEHVRLLREMYAVHRSGSSSSSYYSYGYSYGGEKSIELSAFESRQLWPMLEEADAIGVRLVHARKRLGAVAKYGHAEFCLDITTEPSGTLVITPVIRVDETPTNGTPTNGTPTNGTPTNGTPTNGTPLGGTPTDAAPIRFIGSEGHGVVYIDRAEVQTITDHGDWHLRLAKLARPVPAQLQRMAVDCQRLEIPAAEQARFLDEYYPRLRHAATVISSDESFTPPPVPEPTLVLRASYGAAHDLEVSWQWAYEVGDSQRYAPLDSARPDDGYRDLDAERAVLAGLDLPLEGFGLVTDDPDQPLVPRAAFGGIDTMRFTTEVLPLLADRPGLAVEVTGDPADYREAGDTLSIGVSTDDVVGETDWFDLGVSITVEGREVAFTDVFLALSSGQSHLLLPDGAYFALDKPELRTLARLIEEARALGDARGDRLRISRFQAGLWDELTELGTVHHQSTAWRRQVQGLLSIAPLETTQAPATLAAQLRPYQLDGFRWLAFLWQCRLGGILADDMGLGKTVQSLALICHARQADPTIAPFLIIAPTSVVSNWAAESARFAAGLNVVSLSDTVRRRGQPLDEIIAGAHVVVTSYTLFRIDFDAYSELPWSSLILDEAQYVKNHQSKIYQCARRLPAPVKLAITGTPMENNLMELWSLLSITAPGLFPNPTRFRDYYAQPIEKRGDAELLAQLRRRIKPLIKRRTKEQVAADLPAKQEQVLEVELHPRHRRLYQTHLQRERQKVLGLIDDINSNRFTILRSLTLLRQLSLHAGLVDEAHRDLPSSKIDALVEQLRDVTDGGHRALVFSQFTGFLAHVRAKLDAEGMEYCYLDGKTRNRPAVLQRFKEGSVPVFLISLKAGGFGLNLTEADYCFLLDPWWNPATEAQAVDRTHRIGQVRNVMVYRLIAKDTIEEKVMALQARKAELFSNVMDDGNVFGTSIDANDIRELFT